MLFKPHLRPVIIAKGSSQMSKLVLAIDDDKFIRSLIQQTLHDYCEVTVAENGEQGIRAAIKKSPDIILLDVVMPIKDGFDALAEIRAQDGFKDTPIIILSNLGQSEDVEKGEKLGATDYLVKSNYSLDDVIEKIKKVLDR